MNVQYNKTKSAKGFTIGTYNTIAAIIQVNIIALNKCQASVIQTNIVEL